ncbi:hypothetical protein F441_22740 [Phytophthora nicotianae CJ01A1]|uniref:Uncharacterized protein n=1 Tax=Phytophthora nicotianae CJ01A1 TaxID=1317063 RepID=W2VN97_PHYNI|nr:hypothetical protein F441_22740 [Phytophthora nicotianae CJ01A1]
MSTDTLDDIFLTLQACMLCVLEEDGGNHYKLPHLGKAKLRKTNTLPRVLQCDAALYQRAISVLQQSHHGSVLLFGRVSWCDEAKLAIGEQNRVKRQCIVPS